ncbi:p-loop containing nucleoside triphosphate hydrolase [Diplodia corticola]|uniref:p-loop containing nucleoside triphosphate hydrolase n=1 Tax=Diplodia corticola TaxID=236234 RepID=A0A1J9QXM0_9PEZI|nr:p-loop containing nucleoside triphosphate hydrolase [Diplodia corticola]OJD33136.1 p-loop containing nucleoside triphosphate hydrolase [Diplodia corticola]
MEDEADNPRQPSPSYPAEEEKLVHPENSTPGLDFGGDNLPLFLPSSSSANVLEQETPETSERSVHGDMTNVPGNGTDVPGSATDVPGSATDVPDSAKDVPDSATVVLDNETVPVATEPRNPTEQRMEGLNPRQIHQVVELFSRFQQLIATSTRPNQPPAREDTNTSPSAAQDLVTYTIRSKTSKNDSYWAPQNVSEEEWDRMHVEGYGSVLEMRKDGYLSKTRTGNKFSALIDETMVIHSPYLIKIMPELVGYYPSSKNAGGKLSVGNQMMKVSRPYRMFGGARNNIQRVREKYQTQLKEERFGSDQSREDLELTVKHIEKLEHELDKVLKEPIEMEQQGYRQNPPVASFDMLWLLFRPGELVYTKIDDEWACCMVLIPFWGGGQILDDTWTPVHLILKLWFLDFNGKVLDRRRHELRIENFTGQRNILALDAYPIKYHPDPSLREKLTNRGKKYMTFLQSLAPQCVYDGFVFKDQDHKKTMKERHFYNGKVVVDPVFHCREYGPPDFGPESWVQKTDIWRSDNNSSGEMKKYVDIDPSKENNNLEDSHYLLLARYIRGFTLATRQWVWLDVENMEKYPRTESDRDGPIKELQISPEDLRMIKAFTPKLDSRQRSSGGEQAPVSFDPIAGKGEGRIMLLYGKPGTGKTFTVECLAEDTGRPLLRLSCKELGINPVTLEDRLWKWFRMAEEWQGILLIDEADVYLHQRGLSDSLKSETIVTVFLRALEYYRGILFLTANKMSKFDDAILNRISPLVHMPGLEPLQRRQLIEKYKDKIGKDGRYDVRDGAREKFEQIADSRSNFNGREIKTIFHMAVALATEKHSRYGNKPGGISIDAESVAKIMQNMVKFRAHQEKLTSGGTEAFQQLHQIESIQKQAHDENMWGN